MKLSKEERLKVKKMLDKYDLGISGLAAPFPSPATSKEDEYIDAVKNKEYEDFSLNQLGYILYIKIS